MEAVTGLIILSVAFYLLKGAVGIFSGPRVGTPFTCSSCGKRVKHSRRTISAWKGGLRSSTCGQCHQRWLEEQAAQQAALAASARSSSAWSGCFWIVVVIGVVCLFASL